MLFATLLWFCPNLRAEWLPDGVAAELGLPMLTAGGREVRIWVEGGITRPYNLYRIFETGHGVSGERIVWTESTHDGTAQSNVMGSEDRKMRDLLEKQFCKDSAVKTPHFLFCRVHLKTNVLWPVILADLLPDQLWDLPQMVDRNCGWSAMDGESVGIEILDGRRRHAVNYNNPDFCCPHVSCAIVGHAREVVRRIR